MIEQGLLVANVYLDRTYCGFAVFDATENLQCLDNHHVDSREKFFLGHKGSGSKQYLSGSNNYLTGSNGHIKEKVLF